MTSVRVPGGAPGRRRFIALAAAAAAAGVIPGPARSAAMPTFSWQGIALGADATLTLQHSDEAEAKAAIEACLTEVARLEAVFSLHRPDSALVRLNRMGALDEAPQDLRILLAEALRLSAGTGGAFDPTVQPLWSLYARHFGSPDADPRGPSDDEIARALARTGWRDVAIDDSRIAFGKPGMALTLNGIAQGYITDRIGDLLRTRGFRHVLVNMGEQLAAGPKFDGSAWTVGIADPIDRETMIQKVSLPDGAIATSSGHGCRFDAGGRFTHILDPRTGLPARQAASVSIVTSRATLADGLSTALSVLPISEWAGHLRAGVRAYVVPRDGDGGHWL